MINPCGDTRTDNGGFIPKGYALKQGFTSHGIEYEIDEFGVIHQLNPQPFTYDANYVHTYDTPDYQRQSELLQALRLGFVLGAHGKPVFSLLDFGYGNGAFLNFAAPQIEMRVGVDVTGLPVPGCKIIRLTDGFRLVPEADVYTFWDALEHVPDLSFVQDLPCETVVISLPFCHYNSHGKKWFDKQYKHRKPNEHLHHFDENSLRAFMSSIGWHRVASSNHEDIVRKSPGPWPNILTMAFKRH